LMVFKCRLYFVNYLLCSLHNVLLLNTFLFLNDSNLGSACMEACCFKV
jgi:hypothetical protein